VRTGAVAQAARDDAQGRFRRGEAVGFVEDEVVAWGEPARDPAGGPAALADGAARADQRALGEDAPLRPRGRRRGSMVNGGVELELRHGGQPAYWWLLSAE
jgi:hypothetical protein